ncbi:carboxypeptidase-like regulatory domain-containing protein [Hymenobacter sp. B81]|uniref:carboxypeptidase-like regulatory domain-containing protein n=1 Tax=Hymenobacter sp. B81 TaxID=3344878 RepID=UPI0037DCEA26
MPVSSVLRPLLLLLLGPIFLSSLAPAQQLSGRVLMQATDQPIPFATIGVRGQAIGSTADEAGRFAFADPAGLAATDSVFISCVGFRSRGLTVAQLRQAPGASWRLAPLTHALREVQVRHPQLKPGFLGCRSALSPLQWTTADEDDVDDARGWELATMVPVRRHSYVDGFHVYFGQNEFKSLRLRFMLYDVQEGRPARLLLTDDIQFTVPDQRRGWTSIDLRRYNLHLSKGQTVAAGIQWLQGEKARPDSKVLSGPVLMPSLYNRTLIRQKSEAPWEKHAANVSMYLAVQQYE